MEPPLAGYASRSRCPPDSGGQYPNSLLSIPNSLRSRLLDRRAFLLLVHALFLCPARHARGNSWRFAVNSLSQERGKALQNVRAIQLLAARPLRSHLKDSILVDS